MAHQVIIDLAREVVKTNWDFRYGRISHAKHDVTMKEIERKAGIADLSILQVQSYINQNINQILTHLQSSTGNLYGRNPQPSKK